MDSDMPLAINHYDTRRSRSFKASKNGDLNKAKQAIEKGATPAIEAKSKESRMIERWLPLHIASLYGHESMVSLLLKMCILIYFE
jgi:hypothetical protein